MNGERPVSGAGPLLTDASAAFLVLNEARHRMLGRLFGISRDDEKLLTLILILVVADALHSKASSVRQGPSVADAVLGVGALNDAAHRLAGDWPQDSPVLLALVVGAVVWKHHPLARLSIRGVRGSIHGAITGVRKARAYGAGRWPARPADGRTRLPAAA